MKPFAYFLQLLFFVISGHSQSKLDSLFSQSTYPVGFQVQWDYDHSRSFAKDQYSNSKRPIPAFIWYPAKEPTNSPLTYRVYFDHLLIQNGDSGLSRFGENLREYSLNSLKDQAVSLHFEEWSQDAENTFSELLNVQFRATANAAPIDTGTFPILIYHPGLGGNIIENAILFEFLASWGYIVISSSFHYQSDWGNSFYCGETKNSLEDLDFLIQSIAPGIPNAAIEKIGLIGHSFGAQAGYTYNTKSNNVIKAFISLDNTFDYRPIETIESPLYASTSWGVVLNSLTNDYRNARATILNISGSMDDGSVPDYDLARRLFKSDIHFGSFDYPILHESFLSESILTYPFVGRYYSEQEAAMLKKNSDSYFSLAPLILDFFDKTLKKEAEELSLLNEEIYFAHRTPVTLPTKQQLLELYQKNGLDSIKARYRKFQEVSPKARFNSTVVLDQMVKDGNTEAEIEWLKFLISYHPNDWRLLKRLGESYLRSKEFASADIYLQSAAEFCDDYQSLSEIQEKLKSINDRKQ